MKPGGLERLFADFIAQHGLISPSDRVIAAVSGGVDSMVLLALLDGLRRDLRFDLSVAHVNHRLRDAESDADEAFVRGAAANLGLPCHIHHSEPPARGIKGGPGVQERARAERYAFFESLRTPGTTVRVATAHHRDDNAETVLFNFLRGSGIHGLTGIPVAHRDGAIIRPLLFATREQIRGFAAGRAIAWREDPSNATSKYARNALRLGAIPFIEESINPGVRETLHRTSLLFTGLEAWVDAEVERTMPSVAVAGDGTRLHVGRMLALPLFLRESLILAAARPYVPQGLGYVHVQSILRLADAQTGSSCLVQRNLHASRERDVIVLRPGPPADEAFDFPIAEGESYGFGRFVFASAPAGAATFAPSRFEEIVDADRLREGLRLRSWSDGDWFIPFGMSARKKLSDFFIDRKIPIPEKHRIPILVSGDEVVWVCGERLDDRFRVTEGTKRMLRLRYHPAEA